MATMFVRHAITDYDAWRRVYDAFTDVRRDAGVTDENVYRTVEDPNEITLTLEFADYETARAFPHNEKLQAAFEEAGSIGPPTIWYANRV